MRFLGVAALAAPPGKLGILRPLPALPGDHKGPGAAPIPELLVLLRVPGAPGGAVPGSPCSIHDAGIPGWKWGAGIPLQIFTKGILQWILQGQALVRVLPWELLFPGICKILRVTEFQVFPGEIPVLIPWGGRSGNFLLSQLGVGIWECLGSLGIRERLGSLGIREHLGSLGIRECLGSLGIGEQTRSLGVVLTHIPGLAQGTLPSWERSRTGNAVSF